MEQRWTREGRRGAGRWRTRLNGREQGPDSRKYGLDDGERGADGREYGPDNGKRGADDRERGWMTGNEAKR